VALNTLLATRGGAGRTSPLAAVAQQLGAPRRVARGAVARQERGVVAVGRGSVGGAGFVPKPGSWSRAQFPMPAKSVEGGGCSAARSRDG